jgi:hypothetical protein
MMGHARDFLSFLRSKLDAQTPVASFTQRGVIPFSGGMMWDKRFFAGRDVDWMPRESNPYRIPGLQALEKQLPILTWIDSGEQLVWETMNQGFRPYVCASRGGTGDAFGHPLARTGSGSVSVEGLPVRFAAESVTRADFTRRYPELALSETAPWRKAFDDEGNVVFIHRGRGTHNLAEKRGDYWSYVDRFNRGIRSES